jgi:2-keto-4-pentenoate hydratase/2-oxohepta-3-ene-1,7-dioic acid hydratase in catechol pathway
MRSIRLDGSSVTPSKIVCVGRNYVRHVEELGNELPLQMVVFIKPNSAIGEQLDSECGGEPLDYEGEIALLVQNGRFAAVGFGLDLTKRQLQQQLKAAALPWERAKGFDGAALFSPFVSLGEVPLHSLRLELHVDGARRQQGDVGLMLFRPERILEELRAFLTLEDGDIVMTGTPAGVGRVRPGEVFHGQVFGAADLLVEATWLAQG